MTCSGFTLIELLICILIVAILAVISFSLAGRFKNNARQVNAMGALREVAVANAGFAAENSGKINTMRWVGDPEEGKPWISNSYWGRMAPYLFSGATNNNQKELQKEIKSSLRSFFSTSNPSKMTGTVLDGSRIYHDASGLPVPFGFNKEHYSWGKWASITQIENPARVMYVTYGFGFVTEDKAKEFQERPTDNTSKPIYFMDDGKAIVVFLDGHTESVSAPFSGRMFK